MKNSGNDRNGSESPLLDDGSLGKRATHRNFTEVIAERAQDMPDQTAVLQSDRVLSFVQLNDLINRCATMLHGLGVTKSTICFLAFEDELTLLVVWLATARLNITPVSVDPASTAAQWQQAIDLCHASRLISDRALDQPGLSCDQITMQDIQSADVASPSGFARSDCKHDILHIGSGSTGKPKAIVVPFGGIDAQNTIIARSYDFGPGHVFFSFVKLAFVSGLRIGLASLAAGGAMYIRDTSKTDITDVFGRCGSDRIYTTAVHTEKLLALLERYDQRLGDHIDYRIGSSVVTDDLLKRVKQRVSQNVSIGYGTNEVGSVTVLPRAWEARPPGSVGFVLPDVELEVVDANGTAVATDQPGQVRVRAPGMFSGYFEDAEATRAAIRDGWFYPGDAARMTQDGHLVLLGRTDQMMIWSGVNIYPAEIERVMADHPSVSDVAVMAVRHSAAQDVPVCVVVLGEGRSADETSLMKFAERALGSHAPARLLIVDDIPRNDLGKLDRKALAALVTEAEVKGRADSDDRG